MTVVTVTAVARSRNWNPNVGPWLRAQRGARKQDVVVADLAKRGVVIGRSWLSRAENGAPMSDELLAAFQDYYGSVPPPSEPPASAPTVDASGADAIANAIKRQTEMLEKVLVKLVERTPDPARLDALERAIVEMAANRSRRRRSDPAPAKGR